MLDWFKSHNNFNNIFSSYWVDPQSPDVPAEGVNRGRSVAVAVNVSYRWQVTYDMPKNPKRSTGVQYSPKLSNLFEMVHNCQKIFLISRPWIGPLVLFEWLYQNNGLQIPHLCYTKTGSPIGSRPSLCQLHQ